MILDRSRTGIALTLPVLLAVGSAPHPGNAQVLDDPRPGVVRGSLEDPEAYPRPSGMAVPTQSPPRIDGRLEDDAWAGAPVFTDFVQSQPRAGALATQRSEVRIVYDDAALYIGAMLYDTEAGTYVVQSLERDFPSLSTRDADIFGVTLDTFLDRRNSYILLVNPFGAYRDGQTFNDSRNTDFGFDAPTEVRTAFRDDGWSVEIRIPWQGLRYDASSREQVWGLNLLRRVRRINEDSYWAPLERRDPVHRMSKAGTLVGLSDLPAAGAVWVKPYGLLATEEGAALDRRNDRWDVGADVKYGLTPGLTLDLTANTDFSQVEVDQERVNLTRFPLFFPEQRDFFVENSGSFTFGDQTERNYRMGASLRDFTLFHSRAIGLQAGRPVPILAGGRVSGSLGPWEVGVLDMRTDRLDGAPGENFAVARVRREVAEGSDVGLIFIDRSSVGGTAPTDNRSYGVDANLSVWGPLRVNAYWAATDSPGAEGDQTAARLGAAYRDRRWNVSGLWRRIGEDFNPGVGFARRTDVEHLYGTVGILRQTPLQGVQEVEPYVEAHRFTDLEGKLMTRTLRAGLDLTFVNGATVRARVADRHEQVDEDFAAGGRAVLPGSYDFREGSVAFQSSTGRPFSGSLTLGGGGFFDGDRRSVGTSFRWLVSPRLAIQGSADYNRIELPSGAASSSVYAGRVKYGFSTRAFAALNVQYNEVTEQMVTYARFNVIHGPLSDFFLVLTERRQLGDEGGVLERAVTAKVTRLLSF